MNFAQNNGNTNSVINSNALYGYPQQIMNQQWISNTLNVPSVPITWNNYNAQYYAHLLTSNQQFMSQQQLNNTKINKNIDNSAKEENKDKEIEDKETNEKVIEITNNVDDNNKLPNEEKEIARDEGTLNNQVNDLSLEPGFINLCQQDSTDSFIDSPMDMMTPNTLKSLLSASTYIPDQEREKNIEQKQLIKQEIKQKQERSSKSQLSAACNEFIPGVTVIKRQLSVINEDDEEDLFNDDNFDYFEQAQES